MQTADVMTTNVITVRPDTGVQEIAGLLLKHRISAVPVTDAEQRIVGIVSEGDLVRRVESDTEHRHSWWLEAVLSPEEKAAEYAKTHGLKASDVMTRTVLTVSEDMPLNEVAGLLERHHIKRAPVVRDERLVGIVSRANLLRGLATAGEPGAASSSADDRTIRETLLRRLSEEAGIESRLINVIVKDGVVQLWGLVESGSEKKAARIAAETLPGVKAVENYLGQVPRWMWGY
jgi:CBS domain-containing protein